MVPIFAPFHICSASSPSLCSPHSAPDGAGSSGLHGPSVPSSVPLLSSSRISGKYSAESKSHDTQSAILRCPRARTAGWLPNSKISARISTAHCGPLRFLRNRWKSGSPLAHKSSAAVAEPVQRTSARSRPSSRMSDTCFYNNCFAIVINCIFEVPS